MLRLDRASMRRVAALWRSLPPLVALALAGGVASAQAVPVGRPPAPSGEPLSYVEALAGGAREGAPLPMIVALHGRGDRPERFREQVAALGVPARVVLVRAPISAGPGWAWFDAPPDRAQRAASQRVRQLAPILAQAIARIRARRPTIGRPVVTGFAEGGVMTYGLAVLHPDEIAAAIPIAAYLPAPLLAEVPEDGRRVPPITALHGARDPVVPLDADRVGLHALRSCGVRASLRAYERAGHEITSEMRAHLELVLRRAIEHERERAVRLASR